MTDYNAQAEHAKKRLIHKLSSMHSSDGGPIPVHCRQGFVDYVIDGAPIGSFLGAVFSNQFAEAVTNADGTNQEHLRAYAIALYNYCPARSFGCWGSEQNVTHWQSIGGLRGFFKLQAEDEAKKAAEAADAEADEPDPDAHRIGDSVSERRALDDAGRGHLHD